MGRLLPHVEANNMAHTTSPSQKKHMPSPGFEPRSPRPQSKSDDLDRLAMGPASTNKNISFLNAIFLSQFQEISQFNLFPSV